MVDAPPTSDPATSPSAWRMYTEDWDPAYGNSASFEMEVSADATRAEHSGDHVRGHTSASIPLAFVDGRRRAELSLWAEESATGTRGPGLAGCAAVGAVTVHPNTSASYAGIRVDRVAIWGGGRTGDLRSRSGYRWSAVSTEAETPDQLLAALQERMRRLEGRLAIDCVEAGWNVVLDGPLNRISGLHAGFVVGYVKSHHRRILPPDDHARIPRLEVGERTPLYTTSTDRYTCYIRVGNPGPVGSPWTGIARLEFAAEPGLDEVAARASAIAAALPRFAGAAHRDPRAPVNLTPVKNLETHLSRCMGRVEMATRAAREAVHLRSAS
jgi:hypothetical protein